MSTNQIDALPLLIIEGSANTAKDEPDTAVTDLSQTSADTRDHTDHRRSVGASVSAGSFPLLKVPEGVLQVS